MKDYIFWLGIMSFGILLEVLIVPSPLMFNFMAMILFLALCIFRHPTMFGIGLISFGIVLALTSITPLWTLLGWLGSWGVSMWGVYVIFSRPSFGVAILSIILFRLFHYLFSQPSFWDILQREEIWIGTLLNIILTLFIMTWIKRPT